MVKILVYIGLGSNLSDPTKQIKKALKALSYLPHTHMVMNSPLYKSKPLGPKDQPDYFNAVAALETALAPEELLNHTQSIELAHGRVRKNEHWSARTLDLDILLYGDQVILTERLTVPHRDMKNRTFVLYPLSYIDPDLILPDGESLVECLSKIKRKDSLDIFQL